ncbi:MAG: YdcF family protein [Kiritimatiellae bacterium]|nr:YdcF family protein [Kiritimatiellia bacterium]MDD4623255.1 YdcF family protein [Kiritimatiellia bacterium]
MVWLNKGVWYLLMPMTLGLALMAAGLVLSLLRKRRLAASALCMALLWFWGWSTQASYRALGGALEKAYPPQEAAQFPKADAIVVLGGGMARNAKLPYAEMWSAADRAWHAARLYKAGKAPVVIPTGCGDEHSVVPLLLDLGVPRKAISVEKKARNTEENALFVEDVVRALPGMDKKQKPRVLVVTSAWHMRRALLNFERTGLEVIPAAADHEALAVCGEPLRWYNFFPTCEYLARNTAMMKEVVGYWLYRVKGFLRPPDGEADAAPSEVVAKTRVKAWTRQASGKWRAGGR